MHFLLLVACLSKLKMLGHLLSAVTKQPIAPEQGNFCLNISNHMGSSIMSDIIMSDIILPAISNHMGSSIMSDIILPAIFCRRAKYQLQNIVRTNLASNDAAYNCVFETEDEHGVRGVKLSKDLMSIAGEALKANITTLGPMVLPVSEQLLFAGNMIWRKVFGKRSVKPYVPDFSLAFDHICIHTGGRGVIDEIEKQLRLSPAAIEPSRAALFRFGNVSSSSIWYVLAYIETFRGVTRGDRVWQLGFGSGFKCNSAVWKANRSISNKHVAWEDFDVRKMYTELAKTY